MNSKFILKFFSVLWCLVREKNNIKQSCLAIFPSSTLLIGICVMYVYCKIQIRFRGEEIKMGQIRKKQKIGIHCAMWTRKVEPVKPHDYR